MSTEKFIQGQMYELVDKDGFQKRSITYLPLVLDIMAKGKVIVPIIVDAFGNIMGVEFGDGTIDVFHNPLGYGIIAGLGDKDGKFIPMKPGSQVDGPDTSDDHLGAQLDDFIPHTMSIIVVDSLKVIDVHEQDRYPSTPASG